MQDWLIKNVWNLLEFDCWCAMYIVECVLSFSRQTRLLTKVSEIQHTHLCKICDRHCIPHIHCLVQGEQVCCVCCCVSNLWNKGTWNQLAREEYTWDNVSLGELLFQGSEVSTCWLLLFCIAYWLLTRWWNSLNLNSKLSRRFLIFDNL